MVAIDIAAMGATFDALEIYRSECAILNGIQVFVRLGICVQQINPGKVSWDPQTKKRGRSGYFWPPSF